MEPKVSIIDGFHCVLRVHIGTGMKQKLPAKQNVATNFFAYIT